MHEVIILSKPKPPGVKREQPSTKMVLLKKTEKLNGQPTTPAFDRFKSFGHDLIAKLLLWILKAF